MILMPSMIPSSFALSDELFPFLEAGDPDSSPGESVDSPRRVAARAAVEKLQQASLEKKDGHLAQLVVETQFSDKHEVFGAHLATRSVSAPAGAVIVGAVHKYPTLNVLTKGRVIMVSEHGRRVLVAPCMYMQEANVKKAGWVVEDCTLTNVVMMPDAAATQEAADLAVRAFHTADNYKDLNISTGERMSLERSA